MLPPHWQLATKDHCLEELKVLFAQIREKERFSVTLKVRLKECSQVLFPRMRLFKKFIISKTPQMKFRIKVTP